MLAISPSTGWMMFAIAVTSLPLGFETTRGAIAWATVEGAEMPVVCIGTLVCGWVTGVTAGRTGIFAAAAMARGTCATFTTGFTGACAGASLKRRTVKPPGLLTKTFTRRVR